ncbi:MAG: hypothetical protein JRG86_02190 [Deltaproteobacteria bacterium]|nr:hypothetical protein [Deltaproteobacteria bacterium]
MKVTGGGGPAVGVALVDRPHRHYARPAWALGWSVVGAPTVISLKEAGALTAPLAAPEPRSAGGNPVEARLASGARGALRSELGLVANE